MTPEIDFCSQGNLSTEVGWSWKETNGRTQTVQRECCTVYTEEIESKRMYVAYRDALGH